MASITIHVDVVKGHFQLSGDASDLWSNRRARFFMTDYLTAEHPTDELIIIPYEKDNENNKERVLTQIQDMLSKFDFDGSLTEETQKVLEEHLTEKKKFLEFSAKARKIWWNDHKDKDEFKQFTSVLKKDMPHRKLHHLQLLSAYHLAFSQNACNFSVPGSGKTSVVYAAYTFLNSLSKDDKKYVNKLLVIGPLSAFRPWEDEYMACFGRRADVKRLSSGVPRDERVRHFLSPHSAEITLMTYQGVASNLDDLISYLRRYENKVMVVLDEAHKIKNIDGGVWAHSVLSIAKYCKSRVILTGTPTPNGYEDIYNLYNFIWPDKDIIDFTVHQLIEMSANRNDNRIHTLIENIHPFFIRITKKDLREHMGLPEPIDNEPFYVEMGKIQRSIYDRIENTYLDYFEKADKSHTLKNSLVKARLVRLMQVVTNPALLEKPIQEFLRQGDLSEQEILLRQGDVTGKKDSGKNLSPNDLFIDDSELIDNIVGYNDLEIPEKFKRIGELTRQIIGRGEKVVIWGVFIQTIKQLQEYLLSEGMVSKLLIGETPVDLGTTTEENDFREKIINEFNDKEQPLQIIIANPLAVAESISLHKACHNAIFMERTFNAANFLQSKDRIHRVGLKPDDKINYYYFLSKDSIDETIHHRLLEKEKKMLRIIESKEIPFIKMNMDYESDPTDDIKALIRDYVRRTPKDR